MPLELDRGRLEDLVAAVCDQLDGDWLLSGGALVALWLESRRITEDVDLVGMPGGPEQRLALMSLAQELGLPIESVNSAADFFVHSVDGWKDLLVPFRSGTRGRVFRPSTTLFVLLKIRRLSANDLADCQSLLARKDLDPLDKPRVLAAFDSLPGTSDEALAIRRRVLRDAIAGSSPAG